MRAAINIDVHPYMREGSLVLWRKGVVVWSGPVSAPIGDAEFDRITLHKADFDRLNSSVEAHNNHPVTKLIAAALKAARETPK
jgi:hypothetical protein